MVQVDINPTNDAPRMVHLPLLLSGGQTKNADLHVLEIRIPIVHAFHDFDQQLTTIGGLHLVLKFNHNIYG